VDPAQPKCPVWWSINGQLFPNVPMYMVRAVDVVVMRVDNHSGEVHPMHLHGHHVVVLARDDVSASGSPWWVDLARYGKGIGSLGDFVRRWSGDSAGAVPDRRT
jgi:FtsP/CotA-like multicopper oxidase with cupredoxin domain